VQQEGLGKQMAIDFARAGSAGIAIERP